MLTDDDLTTELRAAFRDATGDLRYAGKVPTPRNRLALGVPLAASAAVVATLAVVWANASDAPAPEPEAVPPVGSHTPRVTDRIEVAGFSVSYLARETRTNDLYAVDGVSLPDDAQPIDAPAGVRAWIGKDPGTGDLGVWVETPTRNGGELFAVLSPSWTLEQLADLLRHGYRDPISDSTTGR